MLLTASNDGFVRGWKYTSNGFILATQPDNEDEMLEHHFKNDIYCMEWDGVNELLYCGQKKGQISIWNLKTVFNIKLIYFKKYEVINFFFL